jgi:uncharacterized protein (TIGR02118 family)
MHRMTVQYDAPGDPDGFERHYRDVHVPLVAAVPGLRRFTLSRPRALAGDAPYLLAEMWFDDADALKVAMGTPEMAETGKDAATMSEQYAVPRVVMLTGDVDEVDVRG